MKVYETIKITAVTGRYVTNENLISVFEKMPKGELKVIGNSVEERPIYQYKIGTGKIKILMWSQMHGNESTTTKAVLDLINLLHQDDAFSNFVLSTYTLCIIPILNPDGAFWYTRSNRNDIDLNRDSQDLTQPESQLLKSIYSDFKPDFGFNLHDQRTIFGVDGTQKPATVSFLSPSFDENRSVNAVRKKAMSVIIAMNQELQKIIPDQVGRFDDGFNINCIGDTLQYNGIPTILFESGHYPNDYEREKTREMIYIALITALKFISDGDFETCPLKEYLSIPQNNKSFCDIMIRNVNVNSELNKKNCNFAILYKEVLKDKSIFFEAYINAFGDLEDSLGHLEYDLKGESADFVPYEGQLANFKIGRFKFENGHLIN